MPQNKYNWSSWNFISYKDNNARLTYWMNYLQNLKCKKDYFVSINSNNLINKKKIIKKIKYNHPVFKYNKEYTFKKLQEIQGLKGNANFLPHLLGHEGCGIVEEIGPAVTTVKPGDKVVMHWKKGLGLEAAFPNYYYNDKKIGGGKVTTLSEYSVVSENRLTKVDNETPADLCALLGCGLSTALGTINYEADLKIGESTLILGCGGLGLNLIQASKIAGSYPVCVFDINDKSSLAASLGADNFHINIKYTNINNKLYLDCINP
jgi:threonine dehydrogenase-like Zn-dependent dehydrogenase